MGWKSTKTITRDEAIYLIEQAIERKPYEKMTNEELEEALYGFGYGDDLSLPYYGYNFSVQYAEEDDFFGNDGYFGNP